MIDPPKSIWIMRIGCSRRNVAEDDGTAPVHQALSQGRHGQRATGDAPLVLEKVGTARIVPDEAAVFHERHGVALQALARRMATGCEARRDHPRARRKYRTMGGELFGAIGEGSKARRGLRRHEIAAQTIEDDEYGARHDQTSTSLSRTEKMS